MDFEQLFYIFKKQFKTKDSWRNEFVSYLFHCPNDHCRTNVIGDHSYGKNKLSITFSKRKCHCWVCGYSGHILKIAKENFSPEIYRECCQIYGEANSESF